MATLNVREYIEESVPAVLEQTYDDLELLILDGGSTDGTLEYVQSIDDDRIRVIENVGGRVNARKRGVTEARGEYIAVVDADTVPHLDRIEKGVEFLERHPDHAAVGSWVRRIETDGSTWIDEKPVSHEEIKAALVTGNAVPHPTMVMRKSNVEAVGGYREHRYEDYDLVVRLSDEYKLANQPEVLLDYYVREEGTVESLSAIENTVATLKCSLLAVRATDLSPPGKIWLAAKRCAIETARFVYNVLYYHRVN